MLRPFWCAVRLSSAALLFLGFSIAAAGQVAILHIQVLEGDGAVHLPGSRSPRPLAIQVTDETGKPVEGASVSFHLPEDGPGGLFNNGLPTDVASTDPQGRAKSRGIQFNRTGGRFEIRIFVSKEQAHAGMASFQYIAEARAAGHPRLHLRRKWIGLIAGLAAGGIAGGVLAGRSGASNAPQAPEPPALTIGAPTISVAKP